MSELREHYVYAYLDPRKPGKYFYGPVCFDYEPFYIGKGIGDRHLFHYYEAQKTVGHSPSRKINKIRRLLNSKIDPIILILLNELSNIDACSLEIELIKSIGRLDLDTGPLTNLTDGGDGGFNKVFTDEIRRNMSLAHIGKPAANKGKSPPPEVGMKISESKKGKPSWNKGIPFSEEARSNMRNAHIGLKYNWTEEATFKRLKGLVLSNLIKLAKLDCELNEESYNYVKVKTCPRFDQITKYFTLDEALLIISNNRLVNNG
jgi:hypothetical protein